MRFGLLMVHQIVFRLQLSMLVKMAEESIFCDVVRICSTVIVEEGVFQMKCEMPFVSVLLSVCLVLYREKKSKTCERLETMFWHNSIVLPPPWASTGNKGPKIHMLRTPAPWYRSHRIQSGNFNTKKTKEKWKDSGAEAIWNKGIKHFSQVILQWKAKIFGLSKTREPLPLSQKFTRRFVLETMILTWRKTRLVESTWRLVSIECFLVCNFAMSKIIGNHMMPNIGAPENQHSGTPKRKKKRNGFFSMSPKGRWCPCASRFYITSHIEHIGTSGTFRATSKKLYVPHVDKKLSMSPMSINLIHVSDVDGFYQCLRRR